MFPRLRRSKRLPCAVRGLLLAPFLASGSAAQAPDWLLDSTPYVAELRVEGDRLELANGLIRRTLRLAPNACTIAFDDLTRDASLLRSVRPELRITLDGSVHDVGGLSGQPDHAFLLPAWLDELRADPDAFQFVGHAHGPTAAPFAWKRVRRSEGRPWPPPGKRLRLDFRSPLEALAGIEVSVFYELYDGLPVLAKWFTLHNGSADEVMLDTFTSEILAVVEAESDVEVPGRWELPPLYVETDYSFGGFTPASTQEVARWLPDPLYASQVNYARRTPCLLEVAPPLGPAHALAPGDTFESFRTFELVHDSSERERRGLARRRMLRTLAPWCTENPILMHVRSAEPDAVRLAIDQCAEVGFEMVILTFGSGFDMENVAPDYLAQMRELADYAEGKGVELGGYSLLSSRRISDEHDVVDPATGLPGGAKFGNAPCLESEWGQAYFAQLERFLDATGFDLLEHDGSYPGDVCGSTSHPGHRGLADSQWRQWTRIRDFYRRCRALGVYLNVPDWYFFSGSNKIGMGYRETNWSLPRELQVLHGRQNIYDGTWLKTPSMGWMFVPLVEYHGGGAAATLEPLSEHLDAYERHLANNFLAGVQACYRGPRLYDTDETRELVLSQVAFFKEHRDILESDVVHVRRPDGRDLDALLHVNPALATPGLLVVHNPTDRPIARTLAVDLYYTGLTGRARVRTLTGAASAAVEVTLDGRCRAEIPVDVPARGSACYALEPGS